MKVTLKRNSSIALLITIALVTILSTLPLLTSTSSHKKVTKFPKNFIITKHWITSTSTITGIDGVELASMTECSKDFNKNFRLLDDSKKISASFVQQNRTLGSFDPLGISQYFGDEYKLLDKNGQVLNIIRRNVFQSLFAWHPSYQIYSAKGKLLGKINFVKKIMNKSIIISSAKESEAVEIAKLDKISSAIGLDSQWRAIIGKFPKKIDRRLLIFLPGLYESKKNSDLCQKYN